MTTVLIVIIVISLIMLAMNKWFNYHFFEREKIVPEGDIWIKHVPFSSPEVLKSGDTCNGKFYKLTKVKEKYNLSGIIECGIDNIKFSATLSFSNPIMAYKEGEFMWGYEGMKKAYEDNIRYIFKGGFLIISHFGSITDKIPANKSIADLNKDDVVEDMNKRIQFYASAFGNCFEINDFDYEIEK